MILTSLFCAVPSTVKIQLYQTKKQWDTDQNHQEIKLHQIVGQTDLLLQSTPNTHILWFAAARAG